MYKEYLKGDKDKRKSTKTLIDEVEKLLINGVGFSQDFQTAQFYFSSHGQLG
ncbi:hypothetical protein [Okeania sp. SIO2C2]|uniref:hypothetical protein n=1 Tax=Okeania sp. SIO2C2 TaxID=2607787 RepID=UPI00257A332F|nr:hypothetical protein [Okeania sp. SIO2C2]